MTVRAMVLTASGINCDPETMTAVTVAGAAPEAVHVNQLLDGERRLDMYEMLIVPGGFSYGDHLGAGSVLATVLRAHLMDQIEAFVAAAKPVLGICNGFQMLSRLGLLGEVALTPNEPEGFICRWVRLRVDGSPCLFLRGLRSLELPIAHGQGRVRPGQEIQGALRYCDNPNGSADAIAGVCNDAGNVFGLMPHPERFVTRWQHPRRQYADPTLPLGLALFQNAVRYVEAEL